MTLPCAAILRPKRIGACKMKLSSVIKKLEAMQNKHGNLEVFFAGPNSDGSEYSVEKVKAHKIDPNWEDRDYDMPAKFIILTN